ncbi:NAD(P)/FAD-dependent oxidoreductase [Marinobacterium mangrovicola]|uniref:3-phenylpropionate/trans-cinnamate dioxygenase ferredoxin reductase subunit n=1 Tax=Marinobacterium mangrovicola TaxID=1476959 RepID=A0A4R1GNU8_9GAMM|nr:FAD-dependent oxidoreductase [Marinobacterium mangrovicola]TCK08940.1 3-phenylpropionate/trans-cinnamate dioxygenase ferredoxin reductase subunit [Marinobacterium mangrovicola]
MSEAGVVILGNGHAGVSVAEQLRRKKYQSAVTLIGAEAGLPYQRPPLSKQYLKGEWDEARLLQRNAEFYRNNDIRLIAADPVISIDPSAHRLELKSGATLPWDKLVLATGSRLQKLEIPGADAEGVVYLQNREQAEALKSAMRSARRAVVIGGGYIGLEGAAALALAGLDVTLVNRSSELLARSASLPVAHWTQRRHENQGVAFRLGEQVAEIRTADNRVSGVRLANGEVLETDLVLVGIGVKPDTDLAESIGLACADGVLVDQQGVTSHPDILAAGDCTRFNHPLCGEAIHLESIQNAVEQGKRVAATLMGEEGIYDAVPWFWSDQYEAKLQIAGIAQGHDLEVIRGDEHAERFSVFCYAQRRLVAVESINAPADHMLARQLLKAGASPLPDDATNPEFNLRSALPS